MNKIVVNDAIWERLVGSRDYALQKITDTWDNADERWEEAGRWFWVYVRDGCAIVASGKFGREQDIVIEIGSSWRSDYEEYYSKLQQTGRRKR